VEVDCDCWRNLRRTAGSVVTRLLQVALLEVILHLFAAETA